MLQGKNKYLLLFIIIIALSELLIVTNPTIDKYEEYVHQQLLQETVKQGSLSQSFGALFGGVASRLVA